MEKSYLDNDLYDKPVKEYTMGRARAFCIASLILRYAMPIILCVGLYRAGFSMLKSSGSPDVMLIGLMNVVIFLMLISYGLSWVFMAYVRIHRKEYIFGKILKWLYIADTLLVIFYMIMQLVLYFNRAGVH